MKRSALLGLLLVVGTLSLAAQPAQPQGPRVIDIQKLKDNLYVLTSSTPGNQATFSGGNVAVFITDTGVTLVDTKLAGWGQAVLDRVKGVTDKPITRIINTHTHGDHTGNDGFFGTTVEIVAQENTKTNMAKMDAFKGDNAKFLPSSTYSDKKSIGAGKDRIDLYYFGAGHTNGDTFVVFPALRVLHTGDMFAWLDGPLCDRNNGGSCVAFPRTLQKALATIKDVDVVIPGHSPIMTPKDLQQYQKFTAALLSHAIDAMKANKTVDEATASFKVDGYAGYKSERVKGSIQAVYDELKK
ncbi:MAG TPA: MBL fold metallo-hydrolase [Vicinamibacterales bacterium]|jgi:glyoxylase-like metal-dependent hydrolase (beta-lactamase superfamily II)